MKKMKKSMLATLLLAGVISLGLTACGVKDGDGEVKPGGGNGGGAVGQQVTADGWLAAFANTDPSNVYTYGVYMEQEDGDKVEEITECTYTPNGFYMKDSIIETYEGEKIEMEAKWWQYQQDGVVYEYEIDANEGEWEVGYDLEVYDEDDLFEMWEDVTGEDIEDVFMNYSAFTYNTGKGVYRLDKTVDIRGVDTICWMEIMISNSKVYSIEYFIDYSFSDSETNYKSTVNTKVVFASQTITYIEQDALNALIASNPRQGGGESGGGDVGGGDVGGGDVGGGDVGGGVNPGEGVIVAEYYLQSLTLGGDLYEIGDLFYDDILTESYYKWTFYSDNTAVYTYAGSKTENCAWNRQGDSIIVESKNLGIVELMLDDNRLVLDCTGNGGALIIFVGEGFSGGGSEGGEGGKDDGGELSVATLVGTYHFTRIVIEGDTYEVGDFIGSGVLTADFYVIGLCDDLTAYLSIQGDCMEGSWAIEGNYVVITVDGDFAYFSYSQGELTCLDGDQPWTVAQTSQEVNPDDFVSGCGSGGGEGSGDVDMTSLYGTYHFESFTYGGETYYVGETFNNLHFTREFMVIALEEDGTAYVCSSDTKSTGYWIWDDDRIYIEANNYDQYFSWENGVLTGRTAPIVTLVKTSDSVDPSYFYVPPKEVGTYAFAHLFVDGTEYLPGDDYQGNTLWESSYNLILNADGTGVYYWDCYAEEMEWEIVNDNIVFTAAVAGECVFEVFGDRITLDKDGAVLVLEKSGK